MRGIEKAYFGGTPKPTPETGVLPGVRRPSIADLFVAVMGRESGGQRTDDREQRVGEQGAGRENRGQTSDVTGQRVGEEKKGELR
jgi:hypothetical protein